MARRIDLTAELRAEYERLYAEADIRPERRSSVLALARDMADAAHWARYAAVADVLGAPAHLVALIHAMECGGRFDLHLHNGDPLTARTVHVPAGRPVEGRPPFSWEESAVDALRQHHLDAWDDWSLAGLAYVLERYNGWGYRLYHPHCKSPYLWSFTTAYVSGKYVADRRWSDLVVSRQPGAMALLRGLAECGKPYNGGHHGER